LSREGFRKALGQRIGVAVGRFPQKKDAADVVGVSVEQLNKWVSGHVKVPADALQALAAAADLDFSWLVTGTGRPGEMVAQSSGLIAVPLLDVRPSAGAGTLVEQLGAGAGPEIVAFREDWLRRIGVSPRFARLMVCQGDSMHDTISDGDLMLVDVGVREVASAGIYVLVYGGLVIVKRVQVLRDRSILLKSDNPRYDSETVPAHDLPELSVEGRVRWAGGSI